MFQKNNFLKIIIIVVVVAACFYVFFYFKIDKKLGLNSKNEPVAAKFEDLPSNSLVSKVFDYLKVPNGVIDRSYKATSPTGAIQITQIYKSSNNIENVYAYFIDLLNQNNNGWKLISDFNDPSQPDRRALFASNESGILNINISVIKDPQYNSIIDLSYVLK